MAEDGLPGEGGFVCRSFSAPSALTFTYLLEGGILVETLMIDQHE